MMQTNGNKPISSFFEANMFVTDRQTISLTPYTWVCRFFLLVKFATSLLALLAGRLRMGYLAVAVYTRTGLDFNFFLNKPHRDTVRKSLKIFLVSSKTIFQFQLLYICFFLIVDQFIHC